MKEVTYKCECGAEDKARLFPDEPVPPAINCWKCGAGRKQDVAYMIQARQGMFPVAVSE